MAIPVFRPTIRRRDMGNILNCLVSDKIDPGDVSRDFTQAFAQALGLAGGISLSTYPQAIALAVDALGLAAGDGVLLSALSPAVYVRILRVRGLLPIVFDVDPETGLVDIAEAERLKARGPKAYLLHHTLGILSDAAAWKAALGIPVVEDISQALGGRVGEAFCGTGGDVAVASLSSEHIVTCGGGGVALSANRQTAAALRRAAEADPLYTLLPDMNAALGVTQIQEMERFLATRREIARAFGQSLLKSRHKTLIQRGDLESVPYSFPVALTDGMKDVRMYALKKNVDTVPAFADSVASLDEAAEAGCPNARSLALRCLLFPLYPMMGKKDVEAVCRVLASLP